MAHNKKLNRIKRSKMLQVWGQLPNPDRNFFARSGVSYHRSLHDLTYIPEIQSTILARESAVIGDPFDITGEDEETVLFIKNNFNHIGINKISKEIFKAIWYGFTVLQHPMEKIEGKWYYTAINSLPSDWFHFNASGLLVPSDHGDSSPMNTTTGSVGKEVELVQYRPSFTNPYGESILTRVFWSATWIKGNLDLWISYIDRFGADSIVGHTDLGNDEKKMSMLHAIQEFRSSGAIVIEGSDTLSTLKTDKSNSSTLFGDFYRVCMEQISRLVLGHAKALDSTTGQLGNDIGLSMVRQDITQDDKALISEVINRLISHLCEVNGMALVPVFEWRPEHEDEKIKIERDEKLFKMGFEFSEEYIRSAYRFNEGDIRRIL